ncbi:MAG: hypothetical protein HC910_16055 [Spirulinaceae cyanobacterium SM2_1_0]|nr:hypothetical protein [Spirulinaceae cyanobacterium SM2_1_0]
MTNQPDFSTMDRQALRAYVLTHRDDSEAFHTYVDRITAESNKPSYPPPQSLDDFAWFANLLTEHGFNMHQVLPSAPEALDFQKLLAQLRYLPRTEKLAVVQFLIAELVQEERQNSEH